MRVRFVRYCLLVASAAVLAPEAGAVVLTATEDNFVLKSAPGNTTVQGTAGSVDNVQLKQATSAQSNTRIAYLKFDLGTLLPADGNDGVLSVAVSTAATAGFTLRAYALNAGAAGFNWSESTITYSNRPAPSTADASFLLDPTLVTALGGTTTVANGAPVGTTVSFPFPAAGVSAFQQADNSLTVIVLNTAQTDNGPSLSLGSSEHATASLRPTLTIVPEPASTALLAAGGAAALLRRRRSS